MLARRIAVCLTLTSFVAIGACHNDQVTNTLPITNATVRFVNATNTNIDIATGDSVASGNGNVAFGATGTCTVVNAANPSLAVEQAGTTNAISGFTSSFQPGGNYTVVAYPSSSGTTQFVTLDNSGFTPTTGNTGLRVFDAASGAGSVDTYVGTGTSASVAGTAFGAGSAFFNVPVGNQTITIDNAGTTTAVVTAPNQTFASGQNTLLVVAPPAAGTTALQFFMVPGC